MFHLMREKGVIERDQYMRVNIKVLMKHVNTFFLNENSKKINWKVAPGMKAPLLACNKNLKDKEKNKLL